MCAVCDEFPEWRSFIHPDSTKQTTLGSFFGAPKTGLAPPRPSSTNSTVTSPSTQGQILPKSNQLPPSSSPASTSLRTPSSLAGSSPAIRTNGHANGNENGSGSRRAGSPLKKAIELEEAGSQEELTPPPPPPRALSRAQQASGSSRQTQMPSSDGFDEDAMDVDGDGSPMVGVSFIVPAPFEKSTGLKLTISHVGPRERSSMPSLNQTRTTGISPWLLQPKVS